MQKAGVKVSIVMSVYNTEDYLEKSIMSCLMQSLDEIEVVVIDNGSTDDSRKVIEKIQKNYPDKLRLIPFDKNTGDPAEPWNHGIKEAKGEYIMLVDSDDWIEIDMCEVLYKKAQEKDYEMVIANHYEVFSEDNIVPVKAGEEGQTLHKFMMYPHMAPWGKIIKRDFFYKHDLWFKSQIHCDTGFNLIAYSKLESVAFVDNYFYYYNRENPMSETNRKKRFRQATIIETLQHVLDHYDTKWEQEIIYTIFRFLYWFAYGEYYYHADIFIPFAKKYEKEIRRNHYIKNNREGMRCILPLLEKELVPKTIICPVFGKEKLTEKDEYCISTWKKYAPGYEIVYLNEKNEMLTYSDVEKAAIEKGYWAYMNFSSAIKFLKEHGGIVLYPDMELLAPIGELRVQGLSIAMANTKAVNSHVIAATTDNEIMTMLGTLFEKKFALEDMEEDSQEKYDEFINEFYESYVLKNGSKDVQTDVRVFDATRMTYGIIEDSLMRSLDDDMYRFEKEGYTVLSKDSIDYIQDYMSAIVKENQALKRQYTDICNSRTWKYGNLLKNIVKKFVKI